MKPGLRTSVRSAMLNWDRPYLASPQHSVRCPSCQICCSARSFAPGRTPRWMLNWEPPPERELHRPASPPVCRLWSMAHRGAIGDDVGRLFPSLNSVVFLRNERVPFFCVERLDRCAEVRISAASSPRYGGVIPARLLAGLRPGYSAFSCEVANGGCSSYLGGRIVRDPVSCSASADQGPAGSWIACILERLFPDGWAERSLRIRACIRRNRKFACVLLKRRT